MTNAKIKKILGPLFFLIILFSSQGNLNPERGLFLFDDTFFFTCIRSYSKFTGVKQTWEKYVSGLINRRCLLIQIFQAFEV